MKQILDKFYHFWYFNIYGSVYWKLVDLKIIIRPDSKIKVGDYYQDCRYRPIKCTENNDGDLWGIDQIDGKEAGCDYYHCGVVPLTEEEVEEHKRIYEEKGDLGLSITYGGWTEEAYKEFERIWRS